MNRRKLVRDMGIGAGLVAGLGFAGVTAQSSGEPVEIRFHARTGAQGDYFQQQADAFHQAQDRIKVTLELAPDAEYDQKLTTMLAGGELGDGWWAAPFYTALYPFASRGVNMDLTELAASAGEDLDDFFPASIQQLTVDGALVGWPLGTHAGYSSLYTNLDAWEDAGAEIPQWDWTYEDEWLSTMQAVTTEDRYGFMFPYNAQAAYTFIRSWGGDWIDPSNGTESLISSPEATDALLFMHGLVHEHKVSPPQDAILPGDDYTTFVNGITASWANGIWAVSSVKVAAKDKFAWQTASMPAGPEGIHGSFQGIDTLCMNAATEHPEETFAWFQWLTSPEAGLAQMDAGLPPTARATTWDEPRIADDPDLAITRQWLETISPVTFPKNARVSEFKTALNQNFEAIMLDSDNPEDAIKKFDEAIQAVLDQPGF